MSQRVGAVELSWQTEPLCCRYLVVHFEALPIRVKETDIARDQSFHWGRGLLADGQHELLGAWPEPVSGVMPWQEIFKDLQVRGVEKIRFVAGDEAAGLIEALRAVFPGAGVLPSIGHLLRQTAAEVAPRDRRSAARVLGALGAAGSSQAARVALADLAASPWGAKYPGTVERWRAALLQLAPYYALAPRLRRVVLRGDEAVQQLQAGLIRVVGRHGCFADTAAALAFVQQALARAERGLRVRKAGFGEGFAGHGAAGQGGRARSQAAGPGLRF